jgi:hypothetical protein
MPRLLHHAIGRPSPARLAPGRHGDVADPGAVLPGVPAARAIRRISEAVVDKHCRRAAQAARMFRKGMFPEQAARSFGGIDKSAFFTAPFRWFSEHR